MNKEEQQEQEDDENELNNLDSGDDESFQDSAEFTKKTTTSAREKISTPKYSPMIWMLSVRPVRRLNQFSPLSLLFQPDTRLFCHHGASCTMNREHQEMYSHELPIFDSQPTLENPEGIPGVIRTWYLETTTNPPIFLKGDELPDILKNNHVIVYVHGHRTRFLKTTAALSHLSLRAPNYPIIGYLWPSHSRKESYGLARSKASTEAAQRLRFLLIALQQLGNSIHIVSHSMGVRLALHALTPTEPSHSLENTEISTTTNEINQIPILHPIESLFMLGAAIPSNAFLPPSHLNPNPINSDNSWDYRNLLVNRIINMYSRQDSVLSSAYQWAEAFTQFSIMSLFSNHTKAMGSVGMIREEQQSLEDENHEINQKLCDIDVSHEVPTHSVHAYLASSTFQEFLRSSLPSPLSLPCVNK